MKKDVSEEKHKTERWIEKVNVDVEKEKHKHKVKYD